MIHCDLDTFGWWFSSEYHVHLYIEDFNTASTIESKLWFNIKDKFICDDLGVKPLSVDKYFTENLNEWRGKDSARASLI